jgi:uncharacterized protein (TIGR00255 family)
MTGFAALSRETQTEKVSVTVKSVNHRFLDAAIKAPHALAAIDGRLRALVQQRVTRGRVELTVAAEVTTPPERDVVIDEALLEQVSAALASVRARGIVSGHLTLSDVLRLPQAFEVRTRGTEAGAGQPPSLLALVDEVVGEALDALVTMRQTEGGFIGADLDRRLTTLAGFVDALEREAAEGQRQTEARLRERIAGLPADLQGDSSAVAQEVVRVVARSDVAEEIVRLRSHIAHWGGLAAAPEPCGRKLDFLVQEMNREINTIGSKVEGARATELVVAAKAELERIREQVQNVE